MSDLTVGKDEQVNLHTDFAVRAKEKERLFHMLLRLLGSSDVVDDDDDAVDAGEEDEDAKWREQEGWRRGN